MSTCSCSPLILPSLFTSIVLTVMSSASKAGLARHPYRSDSFSALDSGCTTPSHSNHLHLNHMCRVSSKFKTPLRQDLSRSPAYFFQHLLACTGVTEANHLLKSSLAPKKHLSSRRDLSTCAVSFPWIAAEGQTTRKPSVQKARFHFVLPRFVRPSPHAIVDESCLGVPIAMKSSHSGQVLENLMLELHLLWVFAAFQ